MIVSLNEIEGLSLKAARGAGMSWGLAEEAAYATRWLAAHGWAADELLAALLDVRAQTAAPILVGTDIRGTKDALPICPIHAGVALADLLQSGQSLTLHKVLTPLWLLPFALRRATPEHDVRLSWAAGSIALSQSNDVDATCVDLAASMIDQIRVELGSPRISASRPRPPSVPAGVPVNVAAWSALETWAARTYVPASLQSRLAGAGAGLSDND